MTRKFTGGELVLATHNKGKLDEFMAMMGEDAPVIKLASDFGLASPPETGTTFLENAKIKAFYAAEKTGKPALADDSGMCVNAFGGEPGVYTADWAERPDGSRDWDWAMEKVFNRLGDAKDRGAQFVCVLVLAWPDGHFETVESIVEGTIVAPRGKKGHGYDPIFQPEGYDMTYAEMEPAQKNAISHRATAFKKMMDKCFR